MFGQANAGKQSKSTTARSVGANMSLDVIDTDIPGLDGNLDDFDFPVEHDDVDMDDPDLLRELDALSGGAAAAKRKPPAQEKFKKPVADVDIEALDALGNAAVSVDDDEIELTEEDMNDPALLGELQGLGYVSDGEEGKTNMRTTTAEPAVLHPEKMISLPAGLPKAQSEPPGPSATTESFPDIYVPEIDDIPLEYKLKCDDPELLVKYIQHEKKLTVVKKRAGDKIGALESLRAYRELGAKFAQINETVGLSTSSPKKGNTNVQKTAAPPHSIHSSPSPAAPEPEAQLEAQVDHKLLNQRRLQYKEASVHFKRLHNMKKAMEMFAVLQNITNAITATQNGGPLPADFDIPPEPDMTIEPPQTPAKGLTSEADLGTSTTASKKKTVTTVRTVVSDALDLTDIIRDDSTAYELAPPSKEDQYTDLEKCLESQISLCMTISAYYLKSGDKISAVTFHGYKKALVADLATLRQHRAHGKDIPRYGYHDVTYTVENQFPELTSGEMELSVVRAWDLGTKDVNGRDVDAFVHWDIGWPTEGGTGKGDTVVIKKSANPEFHFKKTLPIERNRSFAQHIKRKKASFEVFHYRGFLRTSISLGKAYIKFEPLLNKAEIHEVAELVDPTNPRKLAGGKIEIRLRLRTPVQKPDILHKTDKWLIIDAFQSSKSPLAPLITELGSSIQMPTAAPSPGPASSPAVVPTANFPAPTTPVKRPDPASTNPATSKASSSAATAISTSTPKAKQAPGGGGTNSELEKAEDELNSVDSLVSNLVLEQEISLVQSQIAAHRSQSTPVPEELEDRLQALEIKMNLLVVQVQTGVLQLDHYLEQVRRAAARCKEMAVMFQQAKRTEEAKRALRRCKIMEKEVKEVEEAMAAGGLDDV